MAKKAAKKKAPAAKATAKVQKVAKPVAKAPAKVAKPVKAVKAAVKSAKPVDKAKAVKPVKAPAAKVAEVKVVEKKVALPVKVEKKLKAVAAAESSATPKKEKKVKVDKSGMSEDQAKWHELHEKYKATKAPAYSIAGQFEAKTPLQHKLFGWGYILSNEYDRLEVLFEDGKRMLISNRKLS